MGRVFPLANHDSQKVHRLYHSVHFPCAGVFSIKWTASERGGLESRLQPVGRGFVKERLENRARWVGHDSTG